MLDVKLSADRAAWIINEWFSILTEGADGSLEIRPFVLRNYQRRVLGELWDRPNVNLLLEKTRQVGFSWFFAALAVLWLLFSPNEQVLIVGKTENLIDSAEINTNTLMGKMKFILANLRNGPIKALARKFVMAKYMTIKNVANGSIINGASAAGNSGRGGTYTRVIWDEAAFTVHGFELFASISPNSRQLVLLSTANGKNNVFYHTKQRIESGELGSQWIKTRVHWSEYFPAEWYDRQKLKLGNDPVLIARELDIDYDSSTNEKIFYNFTEANFRPYKFVPAFSSKTFLSFDFGIRDRTAGIVIQRDTVTGRYNVADAFELSNVPFALVLKALYTPGPAILEEIRRKTPQKFFASFARFYYNAVMFKYGALTITGDPAAGQRSQLTGETIADALLKYTSKVVFYRSEIEPGLSFIRGEVDKIVISDALPEMRDMVNGYSYTLNARGEPVAPLHNELSHLADAFRYAMWAIKESEGRALEYHHARPVHLRA